MNESGNLKINTVEIDNLLKSLSIKLNRVNLILEEDLLSQEIEFRRQLQENSSTVKKMTQEIENFIESNMREMYKEIVLIRKGYEDELIELMELDIGYSDLINSIKEEMKSEEESIKTQYELSRLKGVDYIIEKYKMNKDKNL